MKLINRKRKGFTLMEIIIVVIIIGILAMLLVPKFIDATKKTNDTAALAEYRTLKGVVSTLMIEKTVIEEKHIKAAYEGSLKYAEYSVSGNSAADNEVKISVTFPSGKFEYQQKKGVDAKVIKGLEFSTKTGEKLVE